MSVLSGLRRAAEAVRRGWSGWSGRSVRPVGPAARRPVWDATGGLADRQRERGPPRSHWHRFLTPRARSLRASASPLMTRSPLSSRLTTPFTTPPSMSWGAEPAACTYAEGCRNTGGKHPAGIGAAHLHCWLQAHRRRRRRKLATECRNGQPAPGRPLTFTITLGSFSFRDSPNGRCSVLYNK